MKNINLQDWVNSSKENKRLFAQEGLILEATEAIWDAMDRRGWKKQDLAQALECTKSHITQLLNGNRNMTLRTLADLAEALNFEAKINFVDKNMEDSWGTIEAIVYKPRKIIRPAERVLAANDQWVDMGVVAV